MQTNTKPDPFDILWQTCVEKYSIWPNTRRLVFPIMFTGIARPLMAEIPADDHRGTMLAVCLGIAHRTRAAAYMSPKMVTNLTGYFSRPDCFRPRDSDPFHGAGVLQIETTTLAVTDLDLRSSLQFHPLWSNRTAQTASFEPSSGLVPTLESKTSAGCVAVGDLDFVYRHRFFNQAHVLFNMRDMVGTLFEVATPNAIIKCWGEKAWLSACKQYNLDPKNVSLLDAARPLATVLQEKGVYGNVYSEPDVHTT